MFPLVFLIAALLQAPPPVRTVAKGPASAIDAPRQAAIRSQAEWTGLWKMHGGDGAPPAIDFSREMVVAVFLGRRPTAGYGVEIIRSIAAPNALVVEYVESGPPRDALTAQVLTAPYHMAAVPLYEGEVTFRRVEK